MYWTLGGGRGGGSYVPPTTVVKDLTFHRWLQFAHDADDQRLGPESEHFYFMSNAPANDRGRSFISRDLGQFRPQVINWVKQNKLIITIISYMKS